MQTKTCKSKVTDQGRARGMRKPSGAVGTSVPGGAKGARILGGADKSTGQSGGTGSEVIGGVKGWQSRVELTNYQPEADP